MSDQSAGNPIDGIAIIGMAGRFPGARSVEAFWENIRNGVESISHFTTSELEIPDAEAQARLPNYVKARAILEDVDLFDASFFGIYPKEAELIDPQHRVFLECCWEALEDAGCDPARYEGMAGVYAGCSANTYFLRNVCSSREFIDNYTGAYQVGEYATLLGTNNDFLATRVSYKMNLKGPSFTMQAGCSTSLLAVAQACQSLLSYQSDMALAGGVSITFPQKRGYLYQEGGMGSADGHCRTFDAKAEGTVFGSGAAVVLLKRLEDALANGDHIYAVIRGSAMNNDGSAKVGYTAPSVEGQARVIAMAQAAAGVEPETIGYIEAHGTATPLGDPIEMRALAQVFGERTSARNFCAIGTAKTNVGHLDVAAGATGLINTVQILRHKTLPPTLHFERPNPKIDLANSPFYVNNKLREWPQGSGPRRAGVSAFGVGGTNAHVIVEEAPELESAPSARANHLIVLSAKSEAALDAGTQNLLRHFKSNSALNMADAAFTLQNGRQAFDHRRVLVCRNAEDAVQALEPRDGKRVFTRVAPRQKPAVAFLFPGQGAQYPKMGLELYQTESVFREQVDRCAAILQRHLGLDIRSLLYPAGEEEEAARKVTQTLIAQPAIFTVEYALARLWMDWGIEPQAMIGHSVGEYVAACLADVFSLEDALGLIAARGRLMQDLPSGAMLAVRLPEPELGPLLDSKLSLAASNAPSLNVVSGNFEAVAELEAQLSRQGVMTRRLHTSHAFHSDMMDPVVGPFAECVKRVRLKAPNIPYLSGVTGTWITAADATDAEYWARHLRQTVRFSDGVKELGATESMLLLEVGPGDTLSTLAKQNVTNRAEQIVTSMPPASHQQSDLAAVYNALGRLWLAGAEPRWPRLYGGERRQRVSLPTYPFERKRYWIEPPVRRNTTTTELSTQPVIVQDLAHTEAQAGAGSAGESVSIATTPTVSTSTRQDRIKAALTSIFEDLSGINVAGMPPDTSFLDMGFDSLFLTQVTQALQKQFKVKITFRQLLDQESTIDALAGYLDKRLPAEVFAEATAPPPAPAVSLPRAAPAPVASIPMVGVAPGNGGVPMADGNAVERVVREQLQAMSQLMAQQLEMLRNSGASVQQPAQQAKQTPAPIPAPQASVPAPSTPPPPAEEAAKPEFKAFGPYKPVQKGVTGGLTPQQDKYLSGLIASYTKRTAESKRLTQASRKTFADPRVASGFRVQWKEMVYPIVTVRSHGSKLWDVDGNEYIDILNGFGPTMFGHAPEFVTKAVAEQLEKGFEIGPQCPLALQVAELICELTGNERATFCNTGSEAVMAALRVARTVTGRDKVVLFTGAYHGTFDEVLVKGFRKGGVPHSAPIAPGIPQEKVDNAIVLDYGTPESLEFIRANAQDLAAVLVEPVQSRHPALQPREFLKEVRKITEESGTALIFDEVVTGFRTHPGGVQALFGIRADLATYGKVLGGGLPLGVLAGKAAFMDALDGGMWTYGDDSYPEVGVTFFAGTFVRHPLAMAACLSVLHHLKEKGPSLQIELTEKTTRLVKRLNDFFEQNQVPTHIENFGSIFYFSFPSDQRFGSLLYYHLRAKGVHIQEGFPCFLTTEHSEADIEHIVGAFQESIREMQQGGVLPAPADGAATQLAQAPAAAQREAPITESQMEILLSAQMGAEASCSYNESFTLRMRGELNQTALRESLRRLLARHEALRASFSPNGDVQHFADVADIDPPLADLSSLPSEERESQVNQMVAADAHQPFDLMKGPLVRLKLVRLEAQHHLLIFTTHHIVCDGWSTNVILDELSRLYMALSAGASCELPDPMPFGDYARSQATHFTSAEGAEIEKYWVEQFAELPPLLDLPTDRPRPGVKAYEGATHRSKIGAEAYRRIKRAGAQQHCTLFVTLLAGFQALLGRLTGQEDIVVGIPAAGQSLLDDATLVGHCVNFVPLRARLAGNPKASEFLTQVKRTLLDAYDHQNYTYGRLVRKLALPRDPSRLPLMEVQFNLERVGTGLSFPGLAVEVDPNPKSFVNFDLFLNVVESDEGLVLDCDYNTALYDEETIARWMRYYEVLLEGIADDASRTLAKLSLMTEPERLLLAQWNQTQADYPRTKCVHYLIEEQAARTPNAVAVVFNNQQLTYAELNHKANQLANHLRKLGVGPEVLVGVFVERSAEMIVALLAVLKSGGAYVPMDPTYPVERVAFVLEDAAVRVMLTQQRFAVGLPPNRARVICLDSDWALISKESSAQPDSGAKPENLAYVIYTSGSTGKPKGVEVPHRSVVNLLHAMAAKPGLDARDTLLAVTTLSFDIAALELFLPLTTGAKLVIMSREAASDGMELLARLASSGATVMQATPITWRLLLEAGWKGDPPLKMLCGGEALPRDLADQLLRCGGALWNMYGPTETTIWSATSQVEPGDDAVTVGPPIANTQFYVLDKNGEPAPIGVPGELHIGGDGLARQYFRRPELTAERFIPSPLAGGAGDRLYKTGDLVRRLPNGHLEFLGRLDDQIKLRGFRIELGEIETALSQHPGVREAVVALREDTPNDKRLVAYVVTDGRSVTLNDVRTFLNGKLPDYMAPSAVVQMDALPLTSNRKVNRRALPAPDLSAHVRNKEFAAPRDPEEQKLADIWAEVLHLDRVGINDNLFELGADSLHIFQIAARANKAGVKLAPAVLLKHRTISAVSAELAAHKDEPLAPAAPAIKAVSREKYRMKRPPIGAAKETPEAL